MPGRDSFGVMIKPRSPRGSGLALAIGFALLLAATMSPAFVRADQAPGPPATGSGKAISSVTNADLLQQCLSDLKAADVQVLDLGVVTRDGCTVEAAVELDAISSSFGKVSLPGKPVLSCPFARRFATWVRDVAAPLTLAYMNAKLSAISTEGAFVCRTRNNRPGEKISEHAKGNAIDIAGFHLKNGQNVTVNVARVGAKTNGVLMEALRTTACGYFTTVLGPGADEEHKEHLHLDYGLHGQTDNYRICE
jgi:hypothetical protein